MKSGLSFGYLLSLALWAGGIFAVTFVVTPIIFKTFGRDMAGKVVGSVFEIYFPANLILALLALAFFFMIGPEAASVRPRLAMGMLVLAVALNVYVTFSLHPRIKAVKAQVESFESAEMTDARAKFKRMHAVSATINLALLAEGVALLAMSKR